MNKTYLTLDVGNTHPHIGIFHNNKLSQVLPFSEFEALNKVTEETWIISSYVGQENSQILDFLEENKSQVIAPMEFRKNASFFEMPTSYAMTLGEDRLFQSYYLFQTQASLLKNYTIVLIDAGTFTTIDFITIDGHLGGFIFPGNQTYLDSFKAGAHLPLLSADQIDSGAPIDLGHIPDTTEKAIMLGLKSFIQGIQLLIDQQISEGPLAFVVTGGHGKIHWKYLRSMDNSSNLIAPFSPHLIHESLFYIGKKINEDGPL